MQRTINTNFSWIFLASALIVKTNFAPPPNNSPLIYGSQTQPAPSFKEPLRSASAPIYSIQTLEDDPSKISPELQSLVQAFDSHPRLHLYHSQDSYVTPRLQRGTAASAPPTLHQPRTGPCRILYAPLGRPEHNFISLSNGTPLSTISTEEQETLSESATPSALAQKKTYPIGAGKITLIGNEQTITWEIPHNICGYRLILHIIQSPRDMQILFEVVSVVNGKRFLGITTDPLKLEQIKQRRLQPRAKRLLLPNLQLERGFVAPVIGPVSDGFIVYINLVVTNSQQPSPPKIIHLQIRLGAPMADSNYFPVSIQKKIHVTADSELAAVEQSIFREGNSFVPQS